jgi:hypothetical protein
MALGNDHHGESFSSAGDGEQRQFLLSPPMTEPHEMHGQTRHTFIILSQIVAAGVGILFSLAAKWKRLGIVVLVIDTKTNDPKSMSEWT